MSEFAMNRCIFGDALKSLRTLPNDHFHVVVTSSPFWGLRDYNGNPKQIGLEPTPELYVRKLVRLFREVRRTMRDDGTLWLDIGDCYAARGHGGGGSFMAERGGKSWHANAALKGFRKAPRGLKDKDLVGIPWRLAFALQADGWYLRSEIIWHKPNPQPESVKDRPSKAHEQIFLLSKSERYFYDDDAIAEPLLHPADATASDASRVFSRKRAAAPSARQAEAVLNKPTPTTKNARDVWTISSQPSPKVGDVQHYATFPQEIARRCILAGSPAGGRVLDPFFGSGTVGQVAEEYGRQWLGLELCEEYAPLIAKRTAQVGMVFEEASNG